MKRSLKIFTFLFASSGLLAPTAQAWMANGSQWRNALHLLAGKLGGDGSLDGQGAAARFDNGMGLAVDSGGNIFVADQVSGTIRKITPAGMVTTFAGTAYVYGSVDGTGSAARFGEPYGLAIDTADNLYLTDTADCTIRKVTPAGVVSTLAGTSADCSTVDGTGAAARFMNPGAIAIDSTNTLYVSEGNGVIRKMSTTGVVTDFVGTAGVFGSANGTGAAASFSYISGLAVDPSGNLFVAEGISCTIRKVSPAGVVSAFAGVAGSCSGAVDGAGTAARFKYMYGLAADTSGNVYVAENASSIIRKITPAGDVSTLAGMAGAIGDVDATGPAARFASPTGIVANASGFLFVTDVSNSKVRKISPSGAVTTLAGASSGYDYVNGTGSAVRFSGSGTLAVDSAGNVYVADNQASAIRKVTPTGVVSDFVGDFNTPGSVDGTGTAARFRQISGLATDASDNLYVADAADCTIRKVTSAGVVSTLAGTSADCSTVNGAGAAARFDTPAGLAVDSSGNVFVAELGGSTIRKITASGIATVYAGRAGVPGFMNGAGTIAQFLNPTGVAVDAAGVVYVTDAGNNKVRKISTSQLVTNVAGTLAGGHADGSAMTASFQGLAGIALGPRGALYVADSVNRKIRKITSAGWVSTEAGKADQAGVKMGALPASLNTVYAVAIRKNKIYVVSENSLLWWYLH